MPKVFLSPSTQEWNQYATDGNEELYMNLLADRIEPYLRSCGISFVRNDPVRNVTGAIADSNAGSYDVHLALHSNAAPESLAGKLRGIDIYYAPKSEQSRRLADIIANNLKSIYPLPDKVRAIPTTSLGEVLRTKAVAVLCELGYHDNFADEAWLKNNLENIARNIVRSLCDYFGTHLIVDARVRAHIHDLYKDRPDVLNRLTATQWLVPETAEILPNRVGSAPLMIFHKESIYYFII